MRENKAVQFQSRRRMLGGAALLGAAVASVSACSTTSAHTMGQSDANVGLRLAMRKLWEEHITYTRNVIISALAGLPDQQAVTQRLLRNQDDIGNAIKPYYGDAAGNQLAQLLRVHIVQAAEILVAAKAGNQAELSAKLAQWSSNGRDIAAFLSGANPHWPRATLETMLQHHLDTTTGEVVARLNGDWAADIRAYDEGHDHMMMVADALTDGIVAQFPDRFA